jgi:hypothetical protein
MLHQLFQSNNIHEKIIVTVEGRSVELCESSDVATVLKSAFSSGLNNKKQGTITFSAVNIFSLFWKIIGHIIKLILFNFLKDAIFSDSLMYKVYK